MNLNIKSKRKIKILIIMIISLLIIFMNIYHVNAAFGFEDLSGTSVSNTEAKNMGNKTITFVSTVGSIISIIVLVALGIKYMMGSAEEKAEYKSSLMPYVIGATLVFAASTIAGVIYQVSIKF